MEAGEERREWFVPVLSFFGPTPIASQFSAEGVKRRIGETAGGRNGETAKRETDRVMEKWSNL
jgi:hypothetical protein